MDAGCKPVSSIAAMPADFVLLRAIWGCSCSSRYWCYWLVDAAGLPSSDVTQPATTNIVTGLNVCQFSFFNSIRYL